MKIMIGSLGHESNTFSPVKTELSDFQRMYGFEILENYARQSALAGIIKKLQSEGTEIVPTVVAAAMPGGKVTQEAYNTLKNDLLNFEKDVDGICLFMHGAMRSEKFDYCESEIVAELRKKVGKNIPITVAMDMHGNLTDQMVNNTDGIVAYHTAPHVDTFETGQRAAELLIKILKDDIKTCMGFAKIPYILPGEMAQTDLEPMASVMKLAAEIEKEPTVLSTSVFKTHCWADVPDQGVSTLVVTKGDAEFAKTEAERLALDFWNRREEFQFSGEVYSTSKAVEIALSSPELPIFLSDSGDNPGAGGMTDTNTLLSELITQNASNTLFATIWDPKAVDKCFSAGVGSELSLPIGGWLCRQYSTKLSAKGVIQNLIIGERCTQYIELTHRSRWAHLMGNPGATAIIKIGGIETILTTNRISIMDPAQIRALGIDPLQYKIIALKRGYLTAPLRAMSARSILALTTGPTDCDVTRLPYNRINRPMYPLDKRTSWPSA